jgi:hypothetical protein
MPPSSNAVILSNPIPVKLTTFKSADQLPFAAQDAPVICAKGEADGLTEGVPLKVPVLLAVWDWEDVLLGDCDLVGDTVPFGVDVEVELKLGQLYPAAKLNVKLPPPYPYTCTYISCKMRNRCLCLDIFIRAHNSV